MTHFDPLLCDPAKKAELEADNGVKQIEYIDHLVSELQVEHVRESHLLELHALAIEGIYPCGGKYRDATKLVHIAGSEHVLPEPAFIESHVRNALELLAEKRESWPAVRRAAYAMWRFNWIHPFAGGNGRASRAIAYLLLCIDHRAMLPGELTVLRLLAKRRDDYIAALRRLDVSCTLDADEPDLTSMETLLDGMLAEQLSSAMPGE